MGEALTKETVYAIGRAFGQLQKKALETKVVMGRDGRLSGEMLSDAIKAGILSTGIEVVDIGMVPTPLLYFATHHLKIPSAVMITGSHNPSHYNGFKIVQDGKALYGEGILALYELIEKNAFQSGCGKITVQNIIDPYIQVIKKDIKLPNRLKIVIDAGNGVTGEVAPRLYETLGCEVIPLFCEVDGRFPNHHPDPGQPQNFQDLILAVQHHQADIGLAFEWRNRNFTEDKRA